MAGHRPRDIPPPIRSGIRIALVNAESLRAHWADFVSILSRRDDDIVAITETHLHPDHSDISFQIFGFSLYRNDRTYSTGGGVAVYVRDGLSVEVVDVSHASPDMRAEHLVLAIGSGPDKFLLGVAYVPPKTRSPHLILTHFAQIAAASGRGLILGDFNVAINRNDSRASAFLRTAGDLGLTLVSREPTYHTTTSHNTLDLVITAGDTRVMEFGQEAVPGLSRQDLVHCSVLGALPVCPSPRTIHTRNLNTVDVAALLTDPELERLDFVSEHDDPNVCATAIRDIIVGVFDRHAPSRIVKVKRPPAPWIDQDIRKRMAERDKLFKRFVREKSAANWEAFRIVRNATKQCLRNAKNRFFAGKVAGGSAELWRTIRAQGGVRRGPLPATAVPPDRLLEAFSAREGSAVGTIAPVFQPAPHPPFTFAPIV
ncbi:uncharacterized protein LOC124159686 [Ischnura elegans]|uniref:uncharacterized protein LOC124159686 n=1 Tax=Ischnura elegans TaxID=197161 RepID=UPI001ED8AAFF|nr:uncharacterized protein LOC124159686 [Ischnura elegans]